MTPTDKPMTVEAVMVLADIYADGPHDQGFYGSWRNKIRAAIEQYGKEQYARGVNDAWPAGRGSGEPVAVEPIIDAYLDDYETAYDEGSSAPDADTKFVIKDAIIGLLADDEFVKAVTPQPHEPVAFAYKSTQQPHDIHITSTARNNTARGLACGISFPVYTAPQPHEPLTDEQIEHLRGSHNIRSAKERDMEYEYEVYVDKSWMAGGSAASPADALGEADHYALMYANDGDVQVFFYRKQIISREDMEAASAS